MSKLSLRVACSMAGADVLIAKDGASLWGVGQKGE